MVRLAGAFRGEPNEGAVVVMRTGDALTSGLPRVAEDVVVHAEGSLAGFVPRFRCAAPEPGLFFAAFDPSSLPGLEMLNTVGLEVKTVLVKMSVDGDHLVGEVVMRFATALSPGPVLDALVGGMRDGLSELTTSAPEVDTTGTNVALRYVAASDEEASAWIERIARIMSDEPPMPVTDARAATRTVTPGRRLPSTTGSNFGVITLTPGFVPDPVTASGTSGGGVDVSTLAFGCVGFATTVPDHVVTLTAPFRELTFMVRGVNGDVSIMVERPDGTLLCNDDYEGTDPLVVGRDLPAGDYRVWIPSGANLNHAYTLGLTELRSVVPSSL
ncbi:MAG: hypothetical protein H6721_07935 [Sandaracinus sp.]|nr:hypothetical protein [Sandaracinus sp.]MCB9632048.1 hypothetical protein [Sandaracinus sp.]